MNIDLEAGEIIRALVDRIAELEYETIVLRLQGEKDQAESGEEQ